MYLKGTLYMKRHLSADSLTNLLWWVDGSYGVHWDSKGHTGAMMSMGKGAIVSVSRKHKLNVGSSTEAELVSIADVLGIMMWCKYFMEEQGNTVENNVLYQDNKSTILLAKNGRMSAGKASKHIKNRFYLVTDKIAQGDLTVEHRPTKEMWADVNTKPLQGKLFREMRAQLMGVPIDYGDDQERRRTHPKLLPRVELNGAIPKSDLVEVLRKASGISRKRPPVKSTPQAGKAPVGQRSVLDGMKHGPGSRPVWIGMGTPRFPNFARVLRAAG